MNPIGCTCETTGGINSCAFHNGFFINSTYQANVFCSNCGFAETISITKGIPISQRLCSNCKCYCLVNKGFYDKL